MDFVQIPNAWSNLSDIADFLEVQCVLRGESYSIVSALKAMSIESDGLDVNGINDEESRILNRLEEALSEIQQRNERCNQKYPFRADRNKIVLKTGLSEADSSIYTYMLFATVWNMGSRRIMAGIDGALLFEELSEKVARSYFGADARSMIFGTGARSRETFGQKVTSLLDALNEGGCFKVPEGSTGRQNDGKLDMVVWKPFSDRRGGKLIGMGQCKTGNSWESLVSQLQPSAFFGSYSTMTPYVDPVRMFFVAASCRDKWEELTRRSGILFDRCRIMDYLPGSVDADLLRRIKLWVSEIIRACTGEHN